MKRTSAPLGALAQLGGLRPVAGDDEREAGLARGVDRVGEALLGRQAAGGQGEAPARRGGGGRDVALDGADTWARSPSGAPSSRRRPSANALGTTKASTCSASRRCHSASPAA